MATEDRYVALANLLAIIIPLGIKAYTEIAANHSQLQPIGEILASADADWDIVLGTAENELKKAGQ